MTTIDELLTRGFQERQSDLPEEALKWFVQAGQLEPEDQTIQLEIARSHLDLAERNKAIKILSAIKVDAAVSEDHSQLAIELARLWVNAGDAEQAVELFRSVPTNYKSLAAQAILELVMVLERTHRLEDAKKELGRHPSMPLRGRSRGRKTYLSAALAVAVLDERAGDLDSAASRLKNAIKDVPMSSALAIECGYRLARLFDRIDQPEKALRILARCKKGERQQFPGQFLEQHVRNRRASDLEVLEQLPPDWFDSRPVTKDAQRVLVLGHPRSGTSLLARQLARLTGATWVDECPAFSVIARQYGRRHSLAGQSFAAYLESLDSDVVKQFEADYIERMLQQLPMDRNGAPSPAALYPDGLRLIDKNPGLSNSLPALNRLLPGSAIVYIERDPRDVATSCYFQRFGSTPLGWSCLTPKGAIEAVLHTATLWSNVKARLNQDSVVVVRYEELVKKPVQVIASVAAGLDWPENERASAEPSILLSPTYAAVRQSIDSSAIGRWKRYESLFDPLPDGQQQVIQQLGYI